MAKTSSLCRKSRSNAASLRAKWLAPGPQKINTIQLHRNEIASESESVRFSAFTGKIVQAQLYSKKTISFVTLAISSSSYLFPVLARATRFVLVLAPDSSLEPFFWARFGANCLCLGAFLAPAGQSRFFLRTPIAYMSAERESLGPGFSDWRG